MNIEIGDRITFRAITRCNSAKATRKVNGFWLDTDKPTVRFEGWGNFVVRRSEIIAINGEEVGGEPTFQKEEHCWDHEPKFSLEGENHHCERCNRLLDPDKLVWLELNSATGEWAEAGKADWTDGPDSQGAFPFGTACANARLRTTKHNSPELQS